ncbi:Scr1 family TA system antitoxin-like transcriptional regulator [Streptomyces sp. NPDC092296]|uniref:helix-turn-helix domain-containing protein n=1 Tax=Streptomyces sp. NPDC092296 TaxID=3366012 RepID=UPI003807A89F
MSRPPNPLTPSKSTRHLFGAEMQECRESQGWSQEELGLRVLMSRSHVSRIENAEAMPPPWLPGRLDELFGTTVFGKLYDVARTEQHPDKYRRQMQFEAKALRIEEYAGHMVPGLVQTKDYARALFRRSNRRATTDELARLLSARMDRQGLLRGPRPPHLSVILDEAVLRRSVGGPTVMREQLSGLLALVDHPSAMVQVLPFSAGDHALLGGSLTLYTLDNGSGAAYEESIDTGTLLESHEDVTERRLKYDEVRACALSPRLSAALIREAMEALPA